MTSSTPLSDAVSAFGVAVKATLANPAITGEPQEQLRTPLVALVKAIAAALGGLAHDTPSAAGGAHTQGTRPTAASPFEADPNRLSLIV